MRAAYARRRPRRPRLRALRARSTRRWPSRGRAAFPLVVKPSRGWGQRGVARVEDDGRARRAPSRRRARTRRARGCRSVVVEAWLEGREYSVNGWIEDGRLVSYCVTERLTVPGNKPLGVMVAEVYPSGLSAEDEARVVEEARRGAAALGHTARALLLAGRASGRAGCFLFETAARLGGGFDADVTRLASGVDLYDRAPRGGARATPRSSGRASSAPVHGGAIAKFLVAAPGSGARRPRAWTRRARSPGVDDAAGVRAASAGGSARSPTARSAPRTSLAHGATRERGTRARRRGARARHRIDTGDEPCDEATA